MRILSIRQRTPFDVAQPYVWTQGRGMEATEAHGRDLLDGAAGLWNVNVGHGRRELGKAGLEQMHALVYPTPLLAAPTYPPLRWRIASRRWPTRTSLVSSSRAGRRVNQECVQDARFYWKARGRHDRRSFMACRFAYHGVTLAAMSDRPPRGTPKCSSPKSRESRTSLRPTPIALRRIQAGETAGQTVAQMLAEALVAD